MTRFDSSDIKILLECCGFDTNCDGYTTSIRVSLITTNTTIDQWILCHVSLLSRTRDCHDKVQFLLIGLGKLTQLEDCYSSDNEEKEDIFKF